MQSELANLQAKRKNEFFRLERIRKKNKLAEQQMAQHMQEDASTTLPTQVEETEKASAKKGFGRFRRKKK